MYAMMAMGAVVGAIVRLSLSNFAAEGMFDKNRTLQVVCYSPSSFLSLSLSLSLSLFLSLSLSLSFSQCVWFCTCTYLA